MSTKLSYVRVLKHPYFEGYRPQNASGAHLKDIVLESKPDGKPLDTKK